MITQMNVMAKSLGVLICFVLAVVAGLAFLKDRDTLVTVVATTEYLEGIARGRPETHNEWSADGALLCADVGEQKGGLPDAVTEAIPMARVLEPDDSRLNRITACADDRYLRVEMPRDGVILRATPGTEISFERLAQGVLILQLEEGTDGSQGVASVGYEGGTQASLGAYTLLIFEMPRERALRGEPLIFPLRVQEAAIGSAAAPGQEYLLISGTASFREKSWSGERYLASEVHFDPGDEIHIRSKTEEPSIAEGFVRVRAGNDDAGGIEVVLHQANSTAEVFRRGASSYAVAPSWTARFAYDPFLVAAAVILGAFGTLLAIFGQICNAIDRLWSRAGRVP
jgi:hypothetical protein